MSGPPVPDTIFALATGHGGAIAIVRISGGETAAVLDRLAAPRPAPRRAALRLIRDGAGEPLDRGLVLWLPGPRSYTGEDCAELHLHAGPAVLEATLRALADTGARPADPGEFTRRAFLSGRIDLIEAEGVADLIAAETQDQRRQALRQAEGSLSAVFDDWAARLRGLLAWQEAAIDFPDETGDAEDGAAHATASITALLAEIDVHLARAERAERLRDGVSVVLAGAPNVGKSSLMNRLTGRDVAIVSPEPGTTRDRLEARIVFEGVPVTLSDTAGLREANDGIEAEGVRRARAAAADADLVLLVRTAGTVVPEDLRHDDRTLLVVNRIDEEEAPPGLLGISATRGDNIDTLRSRLGAAVRRLAGRGEEPVATRARHRSCLAVTRAALADAARPAAPELRGEDLRIALASLGRLTGAVGVEDLLDDIFSRFCIGK